MLQRQDKEPCELMRESGETKDHPIPLRSLSKREVAHQSTTPSSLSAWCWGHEPVTQMGKEILRTNEDAGLFGFPFC